ncbi:MAG: sigma-54 dependent transcriptional regulator [Planctomycetota bacterium]|nr:sigma-54 dependent transcriptional regulator [Planctomycetota bacterium]
MPKAKIVIVDDDPYMREGLEETLARSGYRIAAFEKAAPALAEIADGSAALLITDMRMPEMDGLALLQEARRRDPKLPVVMMTAYGTVETAVEAMKRGAFDYILKPFKAEEIEVVAQRALEHRRLLAENEMLRSALAPAFAPEDFIGESEAMREVFGRIQQVAITSSTVFIRGETGTGKELVAHAIHALSPRRDQAFVRVNCAALSAGVLESELFGHEKGAFTGADRRRVGRFEMADGGTIFLDEVSEMNPELQGKLLRVLQEREFERVGSSETIKVDVRVLASSNRDLTRAIAEGKFRADLYYRLNVVAIDLPPLRARRGDIRLLAQYFIRRFSRERALPARALTPAAIALLEAYDWPGNVRELANIIERALVLGKGDTIDVNHIAAGLERPAVRPEAVAAAPVEAAAAPIKPLEEVEREHVLRALAFYQGHRQKAASALDISERSLRERLKRWREEGKIGEVP